MIGILQKQLATWDEVDLEVKLGHKVVIDFIGRIDGKTFKDGSAKSLELIIGSGDMVPGFEDSIIGLKKNKEDNITVTFPEDYESKDLRGKKAEFTISIKSVREENLPDVDETFFKKLNIKGGKSEFYSEIKQNMNRELKVAIQRRIKSQVFNGLMKSIDFEIPKSFIKREVSRLKDSFFSQIGIESNLKDKNIPDSLFEEKAKQDTKLALIINNIIKKENLEADDISINSMIEEITSVYEDQEGACNRIRKNKKEFENIKATIIENKVVDWVCQQAKVKDKREDFFDLVRDIRLNKSI